MLAAVLAAAVLAADAAPAAEAAQAPAAPVKVTVGVYVNQIHEFSLRDNSFTVDFYDWFRWTAKDLKPYESLSVVDGRIESKTEPQLKDLPGGEKHAWLRVVAKITRFFDTRAYPLDNHQLAITIEEENLEVHELLYEADTVNSAASHQIKLGGWEFERLSTVASEQRYTTNFGDTSLNTG
jgi:hypothetical protein